MTDRELMQQALDVIQYLAVPDRHSIEDKSDVIRLVAETLRARLAQPEPSASVGPAAWRTRRNDTWSYHHNEPHGIPHESLYTAPPQREWVVLTDEEVEELRHIIDWTAGWSYGNFARAIEAKLKEKNT